MSGSVPCERVREKRWILAAPAEALFRYADGVSKKKNVAISLAVIGAVVLAAYLGSGGTSSSPDADALTVVPRDASSVARLDLRHLRSSTLWRKLVHDTGADHGLRQLEESCGYDPLEGARDLVVFVLGDGGEPLAHVGFVLRGHFDTERLAACVGRALNEDGAELRRTEVEGLPAVASGRGDSRIAFVGEEAILGGSEATVARIARTISGEAPNASAGPLAVRFREVAATADSAIVAQPPTRWVGPLRQVIGTLFPEVGQALPPRPLLSLGVRHREGVALDLRLELDSAASAERARVAVAEALQTPRATLAFSAVGLAVLVREIRVTSQGPQLRAEIALEGALLGRVLDLLAQSIVPSERPDPNEELSPGRAPLSPVAPAPQGDTRNTMRAFDRGRPPRHRDGQGQGSDPVFPF